VYNLTAILHLISLAYAIITLTDAAINITEDSVVVEHIIIYISTPIFFVCRVILVNMTTLTEPRLNICCSFG
jgi:positive regulator of sigma E activity